MYLSELALYTDVHIAIGMFYISVLFPGAKRISREWCFTCLEDYIRSSAGNHSSWRIRMKDQLWTLSIKIQSILKGEEGQDLIEYALVVALIAFAATAGMTTLASDINAAFTAIGTKLTSATA
jgi:pilus assembly protein Flp/PilA